MYVKLLKVFEDIEIPSSTMIINNDSKSYDNKLLKLKFKGYNIEFLISTSLIFLTNQLFTKKMHKKF